MKYICVLIIFLTGCQWNNMDSDFKGRYFDKEERLSCCGWHYSAGTVNEYVDTFLVKSETYLPSKVLENISFNLNKDSSVICLDENQKILDNTGKWSVNYKDSAIKINFGNEINIEPIKGKLIEFYGTSLIIRQYLDFDSIDIKRQKRQYRRETTMWFFP